MASGFNVGQDAVVDLFGSDGSSYSFDQVNQIGDLNSFDWDPITEPIRRKTISSTYQKRRILQWGYKGTIGIGRINNTFELLQQQIASLAQQGLPDLTFDIHCTVRDQDGSQNTTTLEFTNCNIWLSKGDNFHPSADVGFTIEFEGDTMSVS